MNRHSLVLDNFFKGADQMRAAFVQRFQNPRQARAERFVWDYWHIPNQYTLLRTPAYHFFRPALYRQWHQSLVEWGREHLGCHDISPPWLSCYVEGCEQQLHADHPHGPWAFVFSLTPWQVRSFQGGETQIFKPRYLENWHKGGAQGVEFKDLFRLVPPKFNRLLVFDPRLPHGVRKVAGVQDVTAGRLVLHGWFVQPRPFFVGPLKAKIVEERLAPTLAQLGHRLSTRALHGYVSLRLTIGRRGNVEKILWLTNTLVGPRADVRWSMAEIVAGLGAAQFPRAKNSTALTVPIRFGL